MTSRSPVLERPCPGPAARSAEEGPAGEWIALGSPEYRRASLALFLAGFATFGLIYCVQPLLPTFAESFSVTPAASSLALSLTTGTLSLAIVASGGVSQAFDRRAFMFASMASAAAMNIATGLSPSWHGVLAARALEGFVLGGVPAVAMAHLAEEIDPRHLGRAMGLYVGGTAFGGMSGRVGMGLLTGWLTWRTSMVLFGVACAAAAVGFLLLLPRPRHARRPAGLSLPRELRVFGALLRDRGLLRLFLIGFLLTSAFVCTFNYATFRLTGPPYGLSPTAASLLFLT
nr:MFS transporter [Aquisphaera giovannonii]